MAQQVLLLDSKAALLLEFHTAYTGAKDKEEQIAKIAARMEKLERDAVQRIRESELYLQMKKDMQVMDQQLVQLNKALFAVISKQGEIIAAEAKKAT